MNRTVFWYGLVVLLAGVTAAYVFAVRPWHMHWGATPQEVALALPGDAYITPDDVTSTRALTIHAPASTVWAWLVQAGQHRGGAWYTYEWLENLFAAEMHPIERISPEIQSLQVGDEMYFHAGGATNPAMVATVLGLQKGRALWLTGGWPSTGTRVRDDDRWVRSSTPCVPWGSVGTTTARAVCRSPSRGGGATGCPAARSHSTPRRASSSCPRCCSRAHATTAG